MPSRAIDEHVSSLHVLSLFRELDVQVFPSPQGFVGDFAFVAVGPTGIFP